MIVAELGFNLHQYRYFKPLAQFFLRWMDIETNIVKLV